MRPRASNEALIGVLFLLAVVSLAFKATLGASVYAPAAGSVDQRLVDILRAQGFATAEQRRHVQSSIIVARRGACVLSVRNALQGAANEALFADEARAIGRVRYLYRGAVSASPPTLRLHLASTTAATLHALGLKPALHVPLALATSAGCSGDVFGLSDLQVPS